MDAPKGSDPFTEQLFRGGELLAIGHVSEAREHLEQALMLQPRNEKAQNLLGLAYFRMGEFPRATQVYEGLIFQNPVDPTLRVNLGLVYLKTGELPRAIEQFACAVDMQPDHKKAHNYLGLALAQAGDYTRAHAHFVAAGSEAMVVKMARAIEAQALAGVAAPQTVRISTPAETAAVVEVEPRPTYRPEEAASPVSTDVQIEVMSEERVPDDAEMMQVDAPLPVEAEIAVEEAPPVEPRPAVVAPALEAAPVPQRLETDWSMGLPSAPRPAAASSAAAPTAQALLTPGFAALPATHLSALAQVPGAPGDVASRFFRGPGGLGLLVDGELLARTDKIWALAGTAEFSPEFRRVRGKANGDAFGEGASQMQRVRGCAVLYVEEGKQAGHAVALQNEGLYLRESALLAFDADLAFEHGRLVAGPGTQFDMVRLAGQGTLLFGVEGSLHALAVTTAAPLTVPASRVIGWWGDLSPRVRALGAQLAIELSGQGTALLAVAV